MRISNNAWSAPNNSFERTNPRALASARSLRFAAQLKRSTAGKMTVPLRTFLQVLLFGLIIIPTSAFGDEPAVPLHLPLINPSITVLKAQRQLLLFSGNEVLRKYRIGLGTNPVGPKTVAGDRRTPEGTYYICLKNPKSAFYLSLGISYPNRQDAEAALKKGIISKSIYEFITLTNKRGRVPPWNTSLGGEIFIHGRGSQTDWTWGCIALDDKDMLELYKAVKIGTPVTIMPG